MDTQLESLQALGIDIWQPHHQVKSPLPEFNLTVQAGKRAVLVIIAAEDQQNWQNLSELLNGILKWLKLTPGSYNLAHVQTDKPGSVGFKDLLAATEPNCILSFGVSLRLLLDSHAGIRYFETLPLINIVNNVINKRQVMNDFAGFSL